MFKIQQNNFNRILRENKKTKRELAKYLGIHENSMNRALNNPKMTLDRIGQIAKYLSMDTLELLKQLYYLPNYGAAYNENNTGVHIINESDEPQDTDSLLYEIINKQIAVKHLLNEIDEKIFSIQKKLNCLSKKSDHEG